MKQVKIGLIGAGNIGKGVIASIVENGKLVTARTGISLVLKSVCDKDTVVLEKIPAIDGLIKTTNASDIINDKEIDIVIELIGGVEPAREFILRSLANKKHVVTANKALLSECWKDVFKAASDNGVLVGFEASVGGGIPVIRVLQESFVSNNMLLIYGILNGTTNFILTMMADKEHSFEKALQVAQERGIAEADPALDISGKDSTHKLAILSLLGFGIEVSPNDIYTEGIEGITPQDIKYARRWGYEIKLLAIAKRTKEGLQLRVHPTLIPSTHLLAGVKGEDNAIFVKGDFVGESLLYGKGAGMKPTASSVMSDVVGISKHHIASSNDRGSLPYNIIYAAGSVSIVDPSTISVPYYLRFSVIDKPGVLAGISSVLADSDISIAVMSQEERKRGQSVPVLMLTHAALEGDMRKAISKIDSMDYVTQKTVVIRMEG